MSVLATLRDFARLDGSALATVLSPSVNKTRRQSNCPYENKNKLTDYAGFGHGHLRGALVGEFELCAEVFVDDVGGGGVAGEIGALHDGLSLDALCGDGR